MISTYENTKNLLTSQSKFHICLGLERTRAVLKILGNPQDKIKIVHIAGTNGKGSTAAILANILKCSGYKTGLYTSPHLVEYTERIRINNKEISKNDFSEYINEICNIADKNDVRLTEFEILTVCAYKYFYDKKVDIAVIETGLGGRFDATNVCKKTFLSIITSISLDHTDRLGSTIEQIAFEKAGIIKEKSAVITEISNKGFKVIKEIAEARRAKLVVVANYTEMNYKNGVNYAVIHDKKYEFPLLGLYQKSNLSLVMKALEYFKITPGSLKEGLRTVNWCARLEYIKSRNLIADGAHNPDGANELKKSLDYYFRGQKRTFIYSTLNTKNYEQIANILFNPDDTVYFYEFNNKNAVTYDEYIQKVDFIKDIKNFKIEELDDILNRNGLKIITGSLYMIGNLYNVIKSTEQV